MTAAIPFAPTHLPRVTSWLDKKIPQFICFCREITPLPNFPFMPGTEHQATAKGTN